MTTPARTALRLTPERHTQHVTAVTGTPYTLHPVQAGGADPVVKSASYDRGSGAFSVPGRTVAVFRRAG
ncbi:alpha-1,6-glucosidase domain-containing protein [Streptomyces olivoreticuli]